MTAISTNNLSKRFGDIVAVDKIDLVVPRNTVFGFLGPNGAGKTTTVKMLTGFTRPTSGSATVAGEDVNDRSVALRSKIGLLPDVPAFYNWMTGEEFLRFVGEIYGMPESAIKTRSGELLDMAELTKAGKRKIGGYSRGMRQRLGIAQALINRPEVLFLDEPTSALDPLGRKEILELITRLKESMTVFMSTHILADVERVCDMVGIIDKGKLLVTSSVSDLKKSYTQSVFEIELMEELEPALELLNTTEWLTSAEIVKDEGRRMLRVRALDTDRANHQLLRLIMDTGVTITRYESVTPDLEDIFVEILKEEVAA